MKVKYIKEGYFKTPEEIKNRVKKSHAQLIVDVALKQKEEEIARFIEDDYDSRVKKDTHYNPSLFLYGKIFAYYFAVSNYEEKTFNDYTLRVNVDLTDNLITFDMYLGAHVDVKFPDPHLYRASSNYKITKDDYIPVDEVLHDKPTIVLDGRFSFHTDVLRDLRALPLNNSQAFPKNGEYIKIELLNDLYLKQTEAKYKGDKDEEEKYHEMWKLVKKCDIKVNKIHMYTGRRYNVLLNLFTVWSADTAKRPYGKAQLKQVYTWLNTVFSFEMAPEFDVYVSYFEKDPADKNGRIPRIKKLSEIA